MNTSRGDQAISEILGTVLLLVIAVSLFCVVAIFFFSYPFSPSAPSVNVVAATEGNNLILEHRGGEPLDPDTKIVVTIGGEVNETTVGALLDQEFMEDGQWNMGEGLVFPEELIAGLQVEIRVIDAASNTVIMRGVLQEGETSTIPYVLTLDASDIRTSSAKLHMFYNFRVDSGQVRFAYKASGGSWINTSWVAKEAIGSYDENISGLSSATLYYFKAQLKYEGEISDGEKKVFTTWSEKVGIWHFDDGTGCIANDSSGRNNDGILNNMYASNWVPEGSAMSGTALSFDGIDDYVRVDDADSLDLTDAITIEAWMKPLEDSEGFIGEIGDAVINTSGFGIDSCYTPDLIHVSGDLYAIACTGTDSDGFLLTADIASDGNITDPVLDMLEFDTSHCYHPDIIHVIGDVYAIAYMGPDYDGFLKTVEIASDGQISDTITDTLEFNTDSGKDPDIIHIAGDSYAIAHTGSDGDGYLTTVEIASDGQINNTVIDTFAFDSEAFGTSSSYDIIHINGNYYGIVYTNPDYDGFLKTVEIMSNGNITDMVIDTLAFDISDGYSPDIIHVNGDTYAIVYRGINKQGVLITVEINGNGEITDSINHTFVFETDSCMEPNIIHINGDVYAIAYGYADYYGNLITVNIASDGQITGSVIDTLSFDTGPPLYLPFWSPWREPDMINVNGDVYAIAFRGSGNDGFLKTVEIDGNGEITDTIIDILEFGLFDCFEPDVIHVSGDVYAIAYRGRDYDGFLKTAEIASNGEMTDAVIDALEFDTAYCSEPNIIHINGDVYAIAYRGTISDLITVEIADDGQITDPVLDTLKIDTTYCYEPTIIHINGDVYAIVYRGQDYDGFLKTVRIANDGQISFITGDSSLEFDTTNCYEPDIIHINENVYAIAYKGPGSDGLLITVEITDSGQITEPIIDTLEFDTAGCSNPDIIPVNGDVYAIAYTDSDYDGFLKTVRIADDGQITDSVIDTLEFDTASCLTPDIIHINGSVYAIAYRDLYGNGFLITLRIGHNGNITETKDDELRFETYYCNDPRIIHIHENVYAIAYTGSTSYETNCIVRTVEINLTGTARGILFKNDAYGIYANSTTAFATINDQMIFAELNSSGFNHVALTYNRTASSDQMKLYINGTLQTTFTLSDEISTNTNDLIIGELNSIIDEITIWSKALSPDEILDCFNEF
jgi:hypothetical protein